MVLSINQFDGDANTTKELGRIHNGEVLVSNVDDFDQYIDRIHDDAKREPGGLRIGSKSQRDLDERKRTVFRRPPLSICNELSVIRRYTPPYGIFASIRPPEEDRDRLLAQENSTETSAPERPTDLDKTAFHLYQSSFDETEPVYLFNIARDGIVFFEGRENVPIEGTHAFKIPVETRQQIVDTCYENQFFDCDHTHIKSEDAEPLPSVTIGVETADTKKWVYRYTRTPPERVQAVETFLKNICHVDLWLDPDLGEIYETLADSNRPDGPALAVLKAACEQDLISIQDADRLIEVLRPSLTAPSQVTRRHAAILVTDALTVSDRSPSAALELLCGLLTDDDETVANSAGDALHTLAMIPDSDSDPIQSLLENEGPNLRKAVVDQLVRIADDLPGTLTAYSEYLATELRAEDPETRRTAAKALYKILQANPAEAAEFSDILTTGLDDSETAVQQYCAQSLAVGENLEPLVERLEATQNIVQTNALRGLRILADSNSTAVVDSITAIDPILKTGNPEQREIGADILLTLASNCPGHHAALAPRCRSLLEDEDQNSAVREKGYDMLAELVQSDNDRFDDVQTLINAGIASDSASVRRQALETAVDAGKDTLLIETLIHDDPAVRSTAATVLESVAVDDSERFQNHLDVILEQTDDDATRSPLSSVVTAIVQEHPNRNDNLLQLITTVEQGSMETKEALVPIFGTIATEQPDMVAQHSTRLVTLLEGAQTETRRELLHCFAEILEHDSTALREHTDRIIAQFDDDNYHVREEASRCAVFLSSASELEALVANGNANESHAASWALARLARYYPERVINALPTIERQLQELSPNELSQRDRRVVEIIAHIAEYDPGKIESLVPELKTALTARGRFTRRAACRALAALGDTNTEALVDVVPAVAPLMNDQFEDVQKEALKVLRPVSKAYPDELRPAVPELVEMIQSGELPIETTSMLGHIAKEYPDVAMPLVDTYKEWVTADDTKLRNNALASLVELADEYPEAIVDEVDTYIEMLTADDRYIRYNATSMMAHLAKSHPDQIEESVPMLIDTLDIDHATTRANACWALGRLNATAAREELERLRDRDSNTAVRAGAIAALTLFKISECPDCGKACKSHEVAAKVIYPERVQWTCPHCSQITTTDIQNEGTNDS